MLGIALLLALIALVLHLLGAATASAGFVTAAKVFACLFLIGLAGSFILAAVRGPQPPESATTSETKAER